MSPNASTSSAEVALASVAESSDWRSPAEQQLVADDAVPLVGDRLADDGDVGAAGGGIGENGHLSHGRHPREIVEPTSD